VSRLGDLSYVRRVHDPLVPCRAGIVIVKPTYLVESNTNPALLQSLMGGCSLVMEYSTVLSIDIAKELKVGQVP
jgi:hypothetical protein